MPPLSSRRALTIWAASRRDAAASPDTPRAATDHGPRRGVLVLVLEHQPDSPLLQLLWIRACLVMAPTSHESKLSREDVPGSVELRWRPDDHQAASSSS